MGSADHPRDRGQADDRAAAAGGHAGRQRRDEQQRRAHVDGVHPVDHLGIDVAQEHPAAERGIVDEHVDATQLGLGVGRQAARGDGVRQVGLDHDGVIRQPRGHPRQRVAGASREGHAGARPVQRGGDPGSDAA